MFYIYAGFIVLRCLFLFSFGYVHPDEFFQGPEVLSKDIFNFETFLPWEYADSVHPCRSIIPVAVVVGIPFCVIKLMHAIFHGVVNCYYVLFMPRFFMFLLSFILDYCVLLVFNEVDRVSNRRDMSSLSARNSVLLTLSSSWCMLVYHSRTFSNTLESIILTITITVVIKLGVSEGSRTRQNSTLLCHLFLGFLLALGIFTRFTFIIFSFPLGITLCYHLLLYEGNNKWSNFVSTASQIIVGFTASFILFAVLDSLYFGSLKLIYHNTVLSPNVDSLLILLSPLRWTEIGVQGSILVTPFNSFLYNMQYDNLALHGIHSRLTHLLVNMPMLYNVGFVCLLFSSIGSIKRKLWTLSTQAGSKTKWIHPLESTKIHWVLMILIASSIFLLSMAPHQEPRFLLPLLFPLSLLVGPYVFSSNLVKYLWITINLLTAIFFGCIHQAGIVPSLCFLQSEVSSMNTTVISYHTYMAPRFLLCNTRPSLTVVDIGGADFSTVMETVEVSAYIISPSQEEFQAANQTQGTFYLERVFWPHLSTEYPPKHWDIMDMNLYLYRYKKG